MSVVGLFAASPSDARRVFPGWRKPMAQPLVEHRRSPYGGPDAAVKVWVIDPDDREPGEPPFPGTDVGARLESLPHAYIDDLDPMVLAAIGNVLLGGAFETWIEAVIEPPVLLDPERPEEDRLCELPLPLVQSLRSLSDERILEAGEALAETIATVIGIPSEPSDCTSMLAELQALADIARPPLGLYYYVFC